MKNLPDKIQKLYNLVINHKTIRYFEILILMVSLVAFMFHIGLIAIQQNTSMVFEFLGENPSYLSAIATPFNFILIYEVLILVVSLPQNISLSVLRQYQVIGLVVIRNVFKDISKFDNINSVSNSLESIREVVLDMGASVVIFLLVGVFLFLKRKFEKLDITKDMNKKFKSIKIVITFFSVIAFFGFLFEVIFASSRGDLLNLLFVDFTQNNSFFTNLFTLLIIADAIILILSFLFDDQFEFIMRDATFIISTILIRVALTSPKPYDVGFAIGGIVFGILGFIVFGIYNKAKYRDLSNVDFNKILNKNNET